MMQTAPDGTVFDDTGPADAPVVVLIHGLGLNRGCWQWMVPVLKDTYRVLSYDLYGHGDSVVPPDEASLALFSTQLAALLDHCGISQAVIGGFSLGGMIARRFAQDHPGRTRALMILHSPHQRSEAAQAAIVARVDLARSQGPEATVEAALDRWFTAPFREANPDVMDIVRGWVMANNKEVYHGIYRVLAEGVDEIVAPDPAISVPALIITGDEDYGNGPEMTHAIAAEIAGSMSVILPGLRHMALAENPEAVNTPVRQFLDELHEMAVTETEMTTETKRALRDAFGRFATGVTVVTTRQPDGTPRGFTANSFTSVSLDPPLLLVCIAKSALSCETFAQAPYFAVNILADSQKDVSGLFASQSMDKFDLCRWRSDAQEMPVIEGSLASFSCTHHQVVDAGDHLILVGRVLDFETNDGAPLGYYKGGYFEIGLEQALADAAVGAGDVSVGAVLAKGEQLLLVETPDGRLSLPAAAKGINTVEGFAKDLKQLGIAPALDHLFAVYQNRQNGSHWIVYHGTVQGQAPAGMGYFDLKEIPFERINSEAERSLLRRYCKENQHGAFGIYHGTEVEGVVHAVSGHHSYHI